MNIPKRIWTFWDSAKLPDTVYNCIETWRYVNPDFDIVVLNKKNLRQYTNIDIEALPHSKDSAARFSDFVRSNILADNGGVWLDASTVCMYSLSSWLEGIYRKNPNTEYVGFYSNEFTSNKRYPVIENWAFACTKNSQFMKRWRDEFMSSNNYETMDKYIEYLEDVKKVNFQNIDELDDIVYLAMHASAQKVLQKDKYSRQNMLLINAEKGPLKYRLFKKGRLSVEKRVARLCKDYDFWAVAPLIKFTGEDRNALQDNKKLRECVFNNVLLGIIKQDIKLR